MRDWWPSSHGATWTAVFAVLYISLYAVNELLVELLQASVVSGRLAIIFLPAFIRVVAVVVAGSAGLLGLFIGSVFISVAYLQDPPLLAFLVAAASVLGVWASYLIMAWAIKPPEKNVQLSLSLPLLMVLTVFYCIFNALIHAAVWSIFGIVDRLGVVQLAQMMLGDLLGVVLMFLIMRWAVKFTRVLRSVAT